MEWNTVAARADICRATTTKETVRIAEERAQATLEYALTIFALLALVVGIACLWRAGESGVFVQAAEQAASHQMEGLGPLDIALF